MLSNWFGTRTPRPSQRDRYVRPKLEFLENRLAPSAMGMGPHDDNGGGDDNGHGHGNGNDNDHEPPGHMRHINDHDDFDIDSNDSVHIVLNNVTINQFFFAAGQSQAQLQQGLVTSLIQAVQTTPGATIQDAFSLVTDEFRLAQDTGMLVTGIISGTGTQGQQALIQDIHSLQTAIQQNPLEASASGQVAGTLAFDLALQLSLSQVAGGQGHS